MFDDQYWLCLVDINFLFFDMTLYVRVQQCLPQKMRCMPDNQRGRIIYPIPISRSALFYTAEETHHQQYSTPAQHEGSFSELVHLPNIPAEGWRPRREQCWYNQPK